VERDPALILRWRALLESWGFGVVTATTLSGALAASRAVPFDLMIIGSSIETSTAEALIRFVRQRGGPPSICLSEENDHAGTESDLLSKLRHVLAT